MEREGERKRGRRREGREGEIKRCMVKKDKHEIEWER